MAKTQLCGVAWLGNAYLFCQPVGWNQVAMTELSGLAWLGYAYIVASQWGGTRLR